MVPDRAAYTVHCNQKAPLLRQLLNERTRILFNCIYLALFRYKL